jgi:hypothetical protein
MALDYNISNSLMKGRLGVYDKNPFDLDSNSINGVEH